VQSIGFPHMFHVIFFGFEGKEANQTDEHELNSPAAQCWLKLPSSWNLESSSTSAELRFRRTISRSFDSLLTLASFAVIARSMEDSQKCLHSSCLFPPPSHPMLSVHRKCVCAQT
jgi:hypothetical protein